MSEYYQVIQERNPSQEFEHYLYVVKPVLDEDELLEEDEDNWEGGTNLLKRVLEYRCE